MQRPIGGINYGPGVTLKEAQARQSQFNHLLKLVPHNAAEKLMKKVWMRVAKQSAAKMSPKEARQQIHELTHGFKIALVRGWANCLLLLKKEPRPEQIFCLDKVLLPTRPDREMFKDFGATSWREVAMAQTVPLVTKPERGQAIEVYESFIANLKVEMGRWRKNRREFVLFSDARKTLIIGEDTQQYFLKISHKP